MPFVLWIPVTLHVLTLFLYVLELERARDKRLMQMILRYIPNKQCVHIYTGPMWAVTSVKEREG